MNKPEIKYDRRQSLKIIDNSTSRKKIPFKKSIELLQMKLFFKRNLSTTPNNQRRTSLSTKVSSEECKLSSNLPTPKNISQIKIPFSDKRKSKVLNTFNSNGPLQTIQEIIPNEQHESRNSSVRTKKRLSENNYILYINDCVKKINFKEELKNLVDNEERKSISSILKNIKDKKLKNSDTQNGSENINNKMITEPKTNYRTPAKTVFNHYNTSNFESNSKSNISREESFQNIKKKYFSPFIYSNDFPKISLKNKYLNDFIDKTISTKTEVNKINNQSTTNRSKQNAKNNSEDETTDFIPKTENTPFNPFNLSNYLDSNKKEFLNESINRCYNNLLNNIDNKISQVYQDRNCSNDNKNKKKYNNMFKTNNSRKNLIMTINSFNSLKTFDDKDYYGNVFFNYNNKKKNSNLFRLLKRK